MRKIFDSLITHTVKPLLKQQGFTKKGLTFYKSNKDLIFVINFQKSYSNNPKETKFYINCGIHSNEILRKINRLEVKLPKEYECFYRQRISDIINSPIDGYHIFEHTDLKLLEEQLTEDLNKVFTFFGTAQNNDDFTGLMLQCNGSQHYAKFFEYLLITQQIFEAKKLANQIFKTYGNEPRWQYFENNLQNVLNSNGIVCSLKKFMESQ